MSEPSLNSKAPYETLVVIKDFGIEYLQQNNSQNPTQPQTTESEETIFLYKRVTLFKRDLNYTIYTTLTWLASIFFGKMTKRTYK